MVRTEIYFGLKRENGEDVTQAEFEQFIKTVITEDFLSGFTVFDAYGQYLEAGGALLKEATKVLLVFHEDSIPESEAIADVISLYRKDYGNAKVMRSTASADVEFYVD